MGDQIMCTPCWLALPSYVRGAVDTCTRAVKNQNTSRNRQRFQNAIANAIRTANSQGAGGEVKS